MLAASAAGAGWIVLRPPDRAPAPPLLVVPGEDIRTGSEAAILANDPEHLTVFRFAPNPGILVLDFPDLAQQGQMLNRVAAFVEKAGLPHDRVLTDAELDAAIRTSGETPSTYYYGHDYRAADLVRFFALADVDGVALTPEEERLRRLLRQVGWTNTNAAGALISIPRTGADPLVDLTARGTILHHELSHGEYFTNRAYAAYVATFWRDEMQDTDRAAFRRFLAADGYDPAIEDLMMNEMQAYLMHTRDPRFFNPANFGIAPARLADLQATFLLGMPPGWLRDCTPGPAAPAPARAPRRRTTARRRQRRGAVSRTKALATTRSCRRCAAAIAADKSFK